MIKSEEFIPLKEEIKNLSHYFSIQKIRYGDCFDDVYNIDERLRDYQVPRFILQPLAENAVLHGTHGGEQIVRITISAHIQGSETIVIAVQDDGKGFDMHNAVLGEHFSGIGISNVDERLRLYYGNEYGLSIESRPGLGTTVGLGSHSSIIPRHKRRGIPQCIIFCSWIDRVCRQNGLLRSFGLGYDTLYNRWHR